MGRVAGILSFGLFVVLASSSLGEIVKVTSSGAPVYNGEKWVALPAQAQGKRFMVYGARQGLYLIQLSAKKDTYAWIRAQDVKVDWGKARVRTATVTGVLNVNTLKLADGTLVQFQRILVPMEDTAPTRETAAWLKNLIEGKEVTLEYDAHVTENERGYEAAYVYVGGVFVNRTLVEYGRAKVPLSNSPGRYDAVFAYHARKAREAGIGIWAGEKHEEEQETAPVVEGDVASRQPDEGEDQAPRRLSSTELAQWDRTLRTEVKVAGDREKKVSAIGENNPDGTRAHVIETTWTKTLEIAVTNGWQRPLKGLSAKYEVFGRKGKSSGDVFVAKTGEINGINLKAGETCRLATGSVQFQAMDLPSGKCQGNKYYGYRVTFYYLGTLVKVVAQPEKLADWGSAEAE